MRYSRRYPRRYSAPKDNTPITEAFKALRRAGYFARQNFWCCQTCAWYDVPDDKAKHAVFYHRQDKERLDRSGTTMLAWSGNAQFICETLRDAGLEVRHDGSDNSRIEIALPGYEKNLTTTLVPALKDDVVWG